MYKRVTHLFTAFQWFLVNFWVICLWFTAVYKSFRWFHRPFCRDWGLFVHLPVPNGTFWSNEIWPLDMFALGWSNQQFEGVFDLLMSLAGLGFQHPDDFGDSMIHNIPLFQELCCFKFVVWQFTWFRRTAMFLGPLWSYQSTHVLIFSSKEELPGIKSSNYSCGFSKPWTIPWQNPSPSSSSTST